VYAGRGVSAATDDDREVIADATGPGSSLSPGSMNVAHALPEVVGHYPRVDRRVGLRRRLLATDLVGGRARIRRAVRWLSVGLLGLSMLMMIVEPHRVCHDWGSCGASSWSETHTYVTDLSVVPLVLLGLAIALQLVGVGRRLLAALITALGSMALAFVTAVLAALSHLLSSVEGGEVAVVSALVATAVALLQLVLEPVLVIGQRRALERTERVVAGAAVVRR